jgi:hypothetical protein
MEGKTDCRIAAGELGDSVGHKLSAFQMAYKSYFAGHKTLTNAIENNLNRRQ